LQQQADIFLKNYIQIVTSFLQVQEDSHRVLATKEPEDHIRSVLTTSHKLALQYKVLLSGVRHVGRMNQGWRSARHASEAHTV